MIFFRTGQANTQIQTKDVHCAWTLNWPQIVGGVAVCCEEGEVCSLQKFSILIISSLYLIIKKNKTQQTWLISMAYHRQKYLVHWHITYLGEVIHIATNLNVPGKKNAVFCHFFPRSKKDWVRILNEFTSLVSRIHHKHKTAGVLAVFFFWPFVW